MTGVDVQTCSLALLAPERCCEEDCEAAPVAATLDDDLVEHIRCAEHDHGPGVIGSKPLRWDPLWGPA